MLQPTKWAVWRCPYDSKKGSNMPSHIVSPIFATREQAVNYLNIHYPNCGYEYGVFKTDGSTGTGSY